jgi:lipopolysaccharide exporter
MESSVRTRPGVRLLGRGLRSDLFASTAVYGSTAFVRLGSSLILTRLLTPEAYGVFAILLTFSFTIAMLTDVGTADLLIRHPRGSEIRFVHTVWTIRLLRSFLNFALLYVGAPLLAWVYHAPELIGPCRLLAVFFPLAGIESMSFILALRNQKARIANYTEFATNLVMTVAVIALAYVLRNAYALIIGFLLQRALLSISSHFFYREVGVGLAFDREAIVAQFAFTRVVMPSSMITMVLNNYEKFIILKLFSASFLGIYSIAGNMLGPVRSIIFNNARAILYPRCSEYFRSNRSAAGSRYYTENNRLIFLGIALPAVVAGFSQSFVSLLYDPRYTESGYILMVLGLVAVIFAFHNASENLLVASGFTRAVLMGNLLQLTSLVPASLLGYYLDGFKGFLWFTLVAAGVPLAYFYYKQYRFGLLRPWIELKRLCAGLAIFLVCLTLSHVFLSVVPPSWLHLHFHGHLGGHAHPINAVHG